MLLFICCALSKSNHNYSYSSKVYLVNNYYKTDLKIHGNYISYKPYLFEFNIRVNQYDSLDQYSGKSRNYFIFDTASIFLIDYKNSQFFEFDSFNQEAKIISQGKLEDKKSGVVLKRNQTIDSDSTFQINHLKDTLIWGKKLLYHVSTQKKLNGMDSLITHIFFIKNPNLISIHDIPSRLIKDTNYGMVGFNVHQVEQNTSISNELEEFRQLTNDEEMICKKFLEKAKLIRE